MTVLYRMCVRAAADYITVLRLLILPLTCTDANVCLTSMFVFERFAGGANPTVDVHAHGGNGDVQSFGDLSMRHSLDPVQVDGSPLSSR